VELGTVPSERLIWVHLAVDAVDSGRTTVDRKIILFEMNEVPFKVLDQFCRWAPESTLADRLPGCSQYQTRTADVGHLSPWTTWPTVHRGVPDERHLIQNFGQDLSGVDEEFPPLWEVLRRQGVRVGICGTLHTYPMPRDLDGYDFYIPDTFAAGSECFPQNVELFQEFNLRMARESARNVADGVPWMHAIRLIAHSSELGFKLQTLSSVAGQLLSERAQKWRLVRRRTYQSVLAFDVFMKQLGSTKPGFTSFFTNHVASSMHRFWAASFPDEYDHMGFSSDWIRTYRREIDWTMRMADAMFARLVRFADRNPEYQVWVATSMGQAATTANAIETQLYIDDLAKFMQALGFSPDQWSQRPAMLPQWNLLMSPGLEDLARKRLSAVEICGEPLSFRERERGFFSIDMGHPNVSEDKCDLRVDNQRKSLADLGLRNVEISDKSGSSAYHIPEGCLFIYDPKDRSRKLGRPEISTLEIAPAILRNFGLQAPGYMAQTRKLAS
jgi:hypothetical protein